MKRLFTASLTEQKTHSLLGGLFSSKKNGCKVQDFVLIPEKRRCANFRILQLQTVNSIIFCISVFAYKLLICYVIVSSACNELGVCPALDLMTLSHFARAGISSGKIVKTGLAVAVKWRGDTISQAEELLDWIPVATYFETKVFVSSLQCVTPKHAFSKSCLLN